MDLKNGENDMIDWFVVGKSTGNNDLKNKKNRGCPQPADESKPPCSISLLIYTYIIHENCDGEITWD